jgi:hypothetical protein
MLESVLMNELTRRLLSEIDVHRAALHEAVQAVPEELRERKPSPDRWSVVEILEHLAITEQRITRLVVDAAANLEPGEPPATAELPVPTMARLLDRTARVEAPERVRPQGTVSAANAWQQLEESRAALRGAVESAEDRNLTAVQRPHPLLGNLDLYQWVISVGGHEARHTVQIRETAAELMAP